VAFLLVLKGVHQRERKETSLMKEQTNVSTAVWKPRKTSRYGYSHVEDKE
jgi:hypothetical protein